MTFIFLHNFISYLKQDSTVESCFVQGNVGRENGSIDFDRYGKDFDRGVTALHRAIRVES